MPEIDTDITRLEEALCNPEIFTDHEKLRNCKVN